MAQTVEIPFSKVFERKSVKFLRMSQLGGFINLARAALLEDFDPFAASPVDLQQAARSTPKQWQLCKKDIMRALEDALPVLREAYSLALVKKAHMVEHGRRCFARGWNPRKEKLKAKKLEREAVKFNFTPDSAVATICQPIKLQAPKLQTNDHYLVDNAQKALSRPKTQRAGLHD